MNRKEINEIRSQFTLEDCSILRLCGCYVDGEKNKISKMNETFLNLPEEERHKYFEIFKKSLSGTPGKNIIDMQFTTDSYADEGARTFLMTLRDSELKDNEILDKFYDNVINNYSYPGNYLILLCNQAYDVPLKTTDNIEVEDGSEEVYRYVLCAICHVSLSKPGLGYNEEDQMFHNQVQSHMVDLPDIGFLFPAFTDRSEDADRILYYTKDSDDFQQGVLTNVLDCEIPMPAGNQKETFQTLVTEALGDECDYETIKNLHENLNEMIEVHKERNEPPVIDKKEARQLLEKSGVKQEKLEDFEEQFENATGENGRLLATNVTDTRKFEVKTPDVVVKVNPDKTDLVETRIIDGRQCLVIQIDENLVVNGISVNPTTGEVIQRDDL